MTSKTGELRWSWLQTFGQLKYCFLVSSECEKETNEDVEDDNYVQHTQKCSFTHSEAMQKTL